MKTKIEPPEFNIVFDVYGGEFIRLRTDIVVRDTVEKSNGEILTSEATLMYEGYLNQEDEIYYHIGPDKFSIQQSVKKTIVISIERGIEIDEDSEILDQMPDPKDPKEIN